MAGGLFCRCPASSQPLYVSCCSAIEPFSVVNFSQRMQNDQSGDKINRGKVFTSVDGDICPRTNRVSCSPVPSDIAVSRKKRVRSLLDKAIPDSADIHNIICKGYHEKANELDFCTCNDFRKPSDDAMADRRASAIVDDKGLHRKSSGEEAERYVEDGEYDPRIKITDAKCLSSGSPDCNYDDIIFGEKKDWSIVDLEKLDVLQNFEYRHGSENGFIVVQAMRVEHMKPIEELLVDSFAELMGGLLTYRPLLALTVQQYVQDRYSCLPNVATLVGLYAPAEDNVVMGRTENDYSGQWLVAGTVEVSFSNAGHPEIPSGPAPPAGSPYLCNMAVSSSYRRRGLGRQLLKAAEELAVLMGAEEMYLHCRMVDLAPFNMYQSAGYEIVATDSILSLLTLQRRRYLMCKTLQAFSLPLC